jgi:hypothetical protein
MKKVLLLIGLAIWVNMIFAQGTATIAIGTVENAVAGPVLVPVTLDALVNPDGGLGENLVSGFALYFSYDASVCVGTPVIVMDSYWTTQGSYVTNTIVDNPVAGTNTIALVWATGGIIPGIAPQSIANVTFNYVGGSTELTWTTAKLKGEGDVKTISYIVDYDGYDYVTTEVNGYIHPEAVAGTDWTGAISADWFDAGNWTAGVPDGTVDVTIPASTPNDPVIVTNDVAPEVAVALNLVSDAPITVGPLGYFTVVGTFANNGGLTVLSDAMYNGSFIFDGALTGDFQYDRYLGNDGTGDEGGWHYVSTPVAGFTAAGNMNDYFINTWDEATSMWVHQEGELFPDCTPVALSNDGMDGWSVKWVTNYSTWDCSPVNPGTGMTVEYMGAPNFGDQFGNATASGAGTFPNFNLIGNPYASYWDWDAYFFGPNWSGNLMDANYTWDEDNMQYASYVAGISTNGGSNFIPPAQGFFVEAIANDALTFTEAERAHVFNVPFWKDAEENLVKLMVSANGFSDETVIHFGEDYTIAMDKNDARKLMSEVSTVPTLYTMASNSPISINGMPATPSVPVFFECATSGTYTIEAIETSEFENVVLEDLLLGTQTSLLESSYIFDHTTDAAPGRFILHFTPLGIGDNAAASINIWSNDRKIYVQSPDISGDIMVFNMMGQEVIRT